MNAKIKIGRTIAVILPLLLIIGQLVFAVLHVYTWMDEGLYSLLGFWAVNGMHPLYERGGPLFQYMPLAFYIPGTVQSLMGPSLYGIRWFSAFVAMGTALMAWRLARRVGGALSGVMTLWLLAGNMVIWRYYATGTPYGWVAFFGVLSAYLLVTKRVRAPWNGILSVLCAVATYGIRQNMQFFAGMMILVAIGYTKRTNHRILVLIAAILAVAALVLPFWPDIAKVIIVGIPITFEILQPIAKVDLVSNMGVEQIYPVRDLVLYFAAVIRVHMAVFLSCLLACVWFLWRLTRGHRRRLLSSPMWMGLSFAVVFLVNLIGHMWGSHSFGPPSAVGYACYVIPLGAVAGGLFLGGIGSRVWAEPGSVVWKQVSYWFVPLLFLTALYGMSLGPLLMGIVGGEVFTTTVVMFYGFFLFLSLVAVMRILALPGRRSAGFVMMAVIPVTIFTVAVIPVVIRGAYLAQDSSHLDLMHEQWLQVGLVIMMIMALRWRRIVFLCLLAGFFSTAFFCDARRYRLETEDHPFGKILTKSRMLCEVTKASDRIFAPQENPFLWLMTDRKPYFPMIQRFGTYVISEETDRVRAQGMWNYGLASNWLREADVIVGTYKLVSCYDGYRGSGQDLYDLVETTLQRDFTMVGGSAEWPIYRRRDR